MYPDFLRLMLRWLPPEPYPSFDAIVVSTEGRLVEEYRALLTLRPGWPSAVIGDDTLQATVATLPAAMRTYCERSVGIKATLPLCVDRPRYLYSDDDVVFVRDPSHMLGDQPWASHSFISRVPDSDFSQRSIREWGTIVPGITLQDYNMRRTDAGMFYLPERDVRYRSILETYFTLPTTHERVNGNSKDKLFTSDQPLLSLWMMTIGGTPMKGTDYRVWATRKLPKSIPESTCVIHYCASSQKPRYVEFLNDQADMRGLPKL